MAVKCPTCERKIKTSLTLFQNTVFRCQCGTRVTVAPASSKTQSWTGKPQKKENEKSPPSKEGQHQRGRCTWTLRLHASCSQA